MFELELIRIDASNSAALETLAARLHTLDADCDKLASPAHATAVDTFIRANASLSLKPIEEAKKDTGRNAFRFFSVDTHISELPDFVAGDTADAPARQNYIQALRKMILATVDKTNGTLNILMDPLKAGERIAIFFRPAPDAPWSIANATSAKKIDYINGLLNHTKIDGLDAQLGIYTFADGTRILTRYYLMEYTDGSPKAVEITTMYKLGKTPDAQSQRMHVPEDSFINTKFQPVSEWEAAHTLKHGTFTHHYVTDSSECEAFIPEDEVQFTIYKSGDTLKTKINPITGRYLQVDADGNPLIQDDHKSVLEDIMEKLAKGQDLEPTISPIHTTPYTPSIDAWQKHNLILVEKIEVVPQGVKVEFKDKSYILDEGHKLTLHGNTQDEHLEAMVLHAKEHWGAFKIDRASDDVRRKLQKLASKHKVDIVDPNEAGPLRAAQRYLKPLSRIFTADAA